MSIDKNARYTQDHEWVRKEGEWFVYGITYHAQDQLSDIVYIEPPQVGDSFKKGDSIGVVESVKAASDLYMPIDGEIVEVNEVLPDNPETINTDPYGEGWIVKIRASDPTHWSALLSPEDYGKLVEEED